MQGTVEVRENALLSALNTFNASMTAAYTNRKTALVAAWGQADAKQRRKSVKAAWDTFKKAKKDAGKKWKESQKSAWKTFRTNVKSCNSASVSADVTVEIMGELSE